MHIINQLFARALTYPGIEIAGKWSREGFLPSLRCLREAETIAEIKETQRCLQFLAGQMRLLKSSSGIRHSWHKVRNTEQRAKKLKRECYSHNKWIFFSGKDLRKGKSILN